MAIIHCPYCGHTVSTTADRCPGCGAPVVLEPSVPEPEVFVPQSQPTLEDVSEEQEEKNHKLRDWILYFILLAFVFILLHCLLKGWALHFG